MVVCFDVGRVSCVKTNTTCRRCWGPCCGESPVFYSFQYEREKYIIDSRTHRRRAVSSSTRDLYVLFIPQRQRRCFFCPRKICWWKVLRRRWQSLNCNEWQTVQPSRIHAERTQSVKQNAKLRHTLAKEILLCCQMAGGHHCHSSQDWRHTSWPRKSGPMNWQKLYDKVLPVVLFLRIFVGIGYFIFRLSSSHQPPLRLFIRTITVMMATANSIICHAAFAGVCDILFRRFNISWLFHLYECTTQQHIVCSLLRYALEQQLLCICWLWIQFYKNPNTPNQTISWKKRRRVHSFANNLCKANSPHWKIQAKSFLSQIRVDVFISECSFGKNEVA